MEHTHKDLLDGIVVTTAPAHVGQVLGQKLFSTPLVALAKCRGHAYALPGIRVNRLIGETRECPGHTHYPVTGARTGRYPAVT